jgi:endonuclease V-like protein UPF0215 family
MLQTVILGGITIAGLGIVDVTALAERLGTVVLVVAYGVGSSTAHAGGSRVEAERLLTTTLGKSRLPEPRRVAHLMGQAIVLRESRGRV